MTTIKPWKEFGAALKNDRKLMGYSQIEFCRQLSEFSKTPVKQQALARWEKGAVPRLENRLALEDFLNHSFKTQGHAFSLLSTKFLKKEKTQKVQEFVKNIEEQAQEIVRLKNVIRTLID